MPLIASIVEYNLKMELYIYINIYIEREGGYFTPPSRLFETSSQFWLKHDDD